AKVSAAQRLQSNAGLCFQGMNLVGKGFRLAPLQVQSLGYPLDALPEVIKPHRNARDMMQGGEDSWVIDFFGFTAEQARDQHPALYQWLLDRVKPERDHNNRESRRRNWWLFGEPVGRLRTAWKSLPRVILTPETSKHRLFEFQPLPFCPDHKLYAICSADAFVLGVLSCGVHARWALRAGGRLGFGNDPTWTNTTCFLPFVFPDASPEKRARIAALAEQIDTHRKRQQSAHPDLTLTGIYNVLEKLRRNEPLNAKEKVIHDHGLVSVLRELHDELDHAVFAAYGWNDLAAVLVGKPGATTPYPEKSAEQAAAEEELLSRLVALNAERAAEEARGLIRWLRPEFQAATPQPAEQTEIDVETRADTAAQGEAGNAGGTHGAGPAMPKRAPWPATLPEQIRVVAETITAAPGPLDLEQLAAHFTGRGPWKKRLPDIVDSLAALGRVKAERVGERLVWRG
ncbi:MAG: class I SAM-dependent DNA methyltransferase, partial [Alphaproteobacteria bacterium]